MYRRFSYLILKRLYSKVSICVCFLLAAVIIACLLASSLLIKQEVKEVKSPVILAQKKIKLNPPYDVLPLESQYCTIFEEDVKKQVKFFGRNARPDAKQTSLGCLVGLENSSNKFFLVQDQKYYLKYAKGYLEFSSKATPIWVKVQPIDDKSMNLNLYFLLSDQSNSKVFQHSKEILLTKSFIEEESYNKYFSEKAWFESFEVAKWWGIDKFYDTYGSQSNGYTKGSQRLDFKGDGSDFLFVNKGELLIYKDNNWQKPTDQVDTREYPLAVVKGISPAKLDLQLYDINGIYHKSIQLSAEKFSPLNIRIEETFTKLRQRSLERLTCKLGNKTVILKEGDWVLKTASGWKVLKNLDEIEKYLNLVTKGELFVFDKIEKNRDENTFLKGRLFDPMRSQLQSIRVPLAKQKKNKRLHSKKKLNFSKLDRSSDIASEDENFPPPLDDDDELLRYSHE